MAVVVKGLVPTKLLAVSDTLYTCAVTATIVDKMTIYNTGGSAVTVTVALAATLVSKTLQALESYTLPEITGHTLNSGETIATTATTGAVVECRVSGREVS